MHIRQRLIAQFKTITAACKACLVCAVIIRDRDDRAGLRGAHSTRRKSPMRGIVGAL